MRELQEPLILSIDTATNTRSVALTRGGQLLAHSEGDLRESQASNVLVDIDTALSHASVRLEDVDLFAVANGPGSFTGLRAGLATIKSFAATLERPVAGVPTLHAIAYAARPASKLVSMIPAGRGEVFAQLLSVTGQGEVRELAPPAHISPSALIESHLREGESLKWAGSAAHAFAALIREGARAGSFNFAEEAVENSSKEDVKDAGRDETVWVLARPVEILAAHVAALASQYFQAGRTVGAADLQAIYVRASDAELNEQWRAQQSRNETQSNTPSVR